MKISKQRYINILKEVKLMGKKTVNDGGQYPNFIIF